MTVYVGGSGGTAGSAIPSATIEAVSAPGGDIDFISSDASVTIVGDDAADTIDLTVTTGMVVTDHGLLSGLADDDHAQYSRADGARPFTAPVSGVNPSVDADLATKDYVDQRDVGHVHLHGNLSGVGVDDHHAQLHGAEHVLSGLDPIDGDSLGIDFNPSNYTPTSSVLSGHLEGIDTALVFPKLHFYADQLDNPVDADWAVNALAPAVADSNNNGLTVRRFDETTEEGVGFIVTVPVGAANLKASLKSRAEVGPGGAVAVVPKLYNRGIPDNAAVQAWSAGTLLTALDFPVTTEYFQYDEQTIALPSMGINSGELTQFELTRVGTDGGDTLSGDWSLAELIVEFT